MRRTNFAVRLVCYGWVAFCFTPAIAQRDLSGADEIKLALDRLAITGSVLMIGAHPDDENTAVLAYFARGRKVDTAYLSLTRGEGGQNLIGPEQGDKLGVIRTQELLAARRIDGAHQFFTRAVDFGFTKSADETMQKWGRERILGDVVWVIRKFRPDIVILRFSGTPRDGHGQHQTSAILGKEAFSAAADPKRFPEQLELVQPWQAKRLMWNMFAFTPEQERELAKQRIKVEIDTGDYDPLLGYSYGEIAGMSRTMHKSQGMGAAERKGSMPQYFSIVAGEAADHDPFDGIDATWNRLPGGAPVGDLLAQASREFKPEHPEKTIPLLLKARPLITAIHDPLAEQKLRDLDNTIALCAGLWVEVTAEHPNVLPGAGVRVTVNALNRSQEVAALERVTWSGTAVQKPADVNAETPLLYNKPVTKLVDWAIASDQPYTQPYWLERPRKGDVYIIPDQRLLGLPENPPLLSAQVTIKVDDQAITIERPVINRYIDRVRGELTRPVAVVPPVATDMPENALVFPTTASKRIETPVRANAPNQTGIVRLVAPQGWRVDPAERSFQIADAGQQVVLSFDVTPPGAGSIAELRGAASVSGKDISVGMDVIDYPHIPVQTLFPPAQSRIARADIKTLAKNIGYIMGAGDEVPQALEQIGCRVTLLTNDDLARGDLSRFDAIVTGVRAWNVRRDLRANRQRVFDYVSQGGTLVVQYNVLEGGPGRGNARVSDPIGPYPIEVSHDRVTVEDVPVAFPNPSSPILHVPNEITKGDFAGWVQERGLYFASKWDAKYQSLLESHDPGEKPLAGGTLFTRYGKGAYIFTGYSWFRQLPAGVPGAYRIFANFLSAGKALARGE
jgi:LmbE family N-acetylglucosaminyl deacetylase